MWAFIIAWSAVIVNVACVVGGIYLEKKFGVYDKVMAVVAKVKFW